MQKDARPPATLNIEEFIAKKQSKAATASKHTPNAIPVAFCLAANDHSRAAFRRLIDFKCIISRQLPKMPREYITKLLFDGKHQSLLAQNERNQAIGGVCFRPFEGQTFVEVVFLAVDTKHRDRRVGSQLIDRLKELLQEAGKNLILTYADNTAIGFFRKQGFEAVLETPDCSWNGYIKTYLEGTLMECKVFNRLKYTKFKPILQENKSLIVARAKTVPEFKFTSEIVESLKGKKDFKFEQVPGVLDSGWCKAYEESLQNGKEFSFVLQQLKAVELMRKFPEAFVFRGLSELPSRGANKSQHLDTWGSIEKRIISGRNYLDIAAVHSGITKMVGRYQQLIEASCKEAAIIREFEKKAAVILKDLLARQLVISVPLAFKESQKEKSRKSHKHKTQKH